MIADVLKKSGLKLGKVMEYDLNGDYHAKEFPRNHYVGFVKSEEVATELRKQNRFYKFVSDKSEAEYDSVLVSSLPYGDDKAARKAIELDTEKNLIVLQIDGDRPVEWFEQVVGETTSRVYHIRQGGIKYSLYIWLR